jgi:hypothetical protein
MCFLLRASYIRRPSDPAGLIGLAEVSTAALTEHLLKQFVPAMFDVGSARQNLIWGPERATRWLSNLARDLTSRRERDIVPWRLNEVLTHFGPVRLLTSGLLSGFIVGTATGVIGAAISVGMGGALEWLELERIPDPTTSTLTAVGLSLVSLLLLGVLQRSDWLIRRRNRQSTDRWDATVHYGLGAVTRFLVGLIGGGGILLLSTLTDSTVAVFLVALVGGLAVCGIAWSLTDWSRDWQHGRSPRLLRINLAKIPDALVYGIGGGLLTGLGAATVIGWEPSAVVAVPAVAVGIAVNFLDSRSDLAAADRADAVLRSDRQSTALQVAAMAVVVGVFAQLGFPTHVMAAVVFGIGLGVGAGLGLSIVAMFVGGIPAMFPSSVWIRYITAKWWLVAEKRIPIRFLSFLDEAYRVGVLRKVGAIYQFRHVDLQEYLAGHAGKY